MKSFTFISIIAISLFILIQFTIETNNHLETDSVDSELVSNDNNEDCSSLFRLSISTATAQDPIIIDPIGGGDGCNATSCRVDTGCDTFAGCTYTEVCNGCSCQVKQISSYGGSSRCG